MSTPQGRTAYLQADVRNPREILAKAHANEAFARLDNSQMERVIPRPKESVLRFFDGWELLDPGLVLAQKWRADNAERSVMWAGVGRKPA